MPHHHPGYVHAVYGVTPDGRRTKLSDFVRDKSSLLARKAELEAEDREYCAEGAEPARFEICTVSADWLA